MSKQREDFRGPKFRDIPQNLATHFRPKPYLRNLSFQCGDDAVLCEPEMNLLLDAVLLTLSCLPNVSTMGALIIDGKRPDRDAECLVRADLAEGEGSQLYRLAAEAIDGILDNIQLDPGKGNVYHYNDNHHPKVLVLGAAHGHFLVTIKFAPTLAGTSIHYEDIVLLVIATTLVQMRPEDNVAQTALQGIMDNIRDVTMDELKFVDLVKHVLKNSKLPMAAAWKDWLKSSGAENRPKEYFG